MEDAREKFVHFMWDRSTVRIDDGHPSWSPHIYESLIDTEAVDSQKWIDENRESTDMGLIIYVFDNVYNMTPGKHRRALLYTLNMLYFDL